MIRRILLAAVAVVALLFWAEVGVRVSRVMDVPVFHADNRIGYIPAPDQSGRWLWKNAFAFNSDSMGTAAPFRPSGRTDVLLLGDSLVYGGVNYREAERLGPSLQRLTAARIWPASAPSWGLQNELQYLLDHPSVLRGTDMIVLVTNSADYGDPSSWASEVTHPRSLGWSRLWTLFQKWRSPPSEIQPAYRVPPKPLAAMVTEVRRIWQGPLIVVAYPTKAEAAAAGWRGCGFALPAYLARAADATVCVGEKGWREAYYRDAIHPTGEGDMRLAVIIDAALRTLGPMTETPPRT